MDKLLALVFVFLLFLCHSLVRLTRFMLDQHHLYKALVNIPGPEFRLSFFGNLNLLLEIAKNSDNRADVSKEFNNLMIKLCDQFGSKKYGLVRLWLGPFLPIVIICDAKTAQLVLNSPHYVDKASFYGIFRFAIGDGIFTCNSAKLKEQKKSLREHFKFRSLQQYMHNAERHLQVFNERLDSCIQENEGCFSDAKAIVSPFVLDTLGENLFSTEFNSQVVGEPKFVQLVHSLLEISYNAFLHPWTYFFSNALLRYIVNFSMIKNAFGPILYFKRSTLKIVRDRYERMISGQTTEYAKEEPVTAPNQSLLDSLITARLVESKLTRLHEIDRQINTFVIAGHDTTTSSITWTLYLLAHHPEVQQRLREEIDGFLEELNATEEKVNLVNIKKLKYLDCCIKESLRLYPSGPFIGRRARQPVKINEEVTLPANINVIIFIHYMHTREDYFRDAQRFYPDRFLLSSEQQTSDRPWHTNAALMPFSSGLRVCIGKEYGIVQQKLFLINLLSKYTFSALDKFGSAQPKRFFLLSSAHYPIKFQRRIDK